MKEWVASVRCDTVAIVTFATVPSSDKNRLEKTNEMMQLPKQKTAPLKDCINNHVHRLGNRRFR